MKRTMTTTIFSVVTLSGAIAGAEPRLLGSGAPACGNVRSKRGNPCAERAMAAAEAAEPATPVYTRDVIGGVLAAIAGFEEPRAATILPTLAMYRSAAAIAPRTPLMLDDGAPAAGNVGKAARDMDTDR